MKTKLIAQVRLHTLVVPLVERSESNLRETPAPMTPKSSGSHHSGLCLQEGLSPGVAAELNHVLHAVAGDG